MHTLIGCLILLLLSLFCGVLLRRFAQERDPWLLSLASVGLGGILLILGGALLLPWLAPGGAVALLAALAVAGLALTAGTPWSSPLEARQEALLVTLGALPGMLLTGYFALFTMSVSFGVDDGFFLHTSNIGMILAGKFPPSGFLGEPLQGHYGKDLLTALLALAFTESFLEVEWISTCAIQVLHFLFMAHWLRVEGGGVAGGLLGAYFAFFASAFGSHLGLVDTMANNNAVAYWTLTLCSYLCLRWWRNGDWQTAVLAGVVLGADALIYELHFGLIGLTLFSFCLFSKERRKGFVLLVLTAVLLACVEGGAITHLARKAVLGRAAHEQNTRKAWQSQDVALTFPKDRPFVLRRDNLRPSRFFETKLRPAGADFQPSRESVPLWSPSILACFWYPVWLAPLTLVALVRTRNWLAGWFFSLGFYSVLTPCVVSFGYFEAETARWLFGASFAFSTAFSLVLARALQAPRPWRHGAWALLLWSLWFNLPVIPLELEEMRQALAQPGNPLLDGSPGIVPNGGLWPNPKLSLSHHYGFDEADFLVTEQLRKAAFSDADLRGSRYLVNYPDEVGTRGVEQASGGMLNIIGLQTGLSGRLPAGLAGAPENDWCAPLFTQKLQARAFWADPQRWRLEDLSVRWLLVDESRLEQSSRQRLAAIPGLKKIFGSGQQTLWELGPSEAAREATGTSASVKSLDMVNVSQGLLARQPFVLWGDGETSGAGEARLEFRYLAADSGAPANPDDLIAAGYAVPGAHSMSSVQLVGPYYPGRYKLEWRQVGETDWNALAELGFSEGLTSVRTAP